MLEDEDQFSDEEVTELLRAASLFLSGLRFPSVKKQQTKRLWYRSMHEFTAVLMDDFEVGKCGPDLERCSDGACMPIGGC